MNESAVRRCDFVFAQGINPPDRYMAITVMPQKVREGCAGPTEVFARGHSCKIWNLGLEKIQKIRVIMELELDLKSIWRICIFLPPKSSPIPIPAIKLNSK